MNKKPHVNAIVSRSFSQPPVQVFDACLSPELIAEWMFGPRLREEEIVHIQVDPKVGGSFSFLVKRNGQELDHTGKYLEIERPRHLLFTWTVNDGDSSRVHITIVPKGSGCELTLTHELHPDWQDFLSRSEEAWVKMLAVLASVLNEKHA